MALLNTAHRGDAIVLWAEEFQMALCQPTNQPTKLLEIENSTNERTNERTRLLAQRLVDSMFN